MLESLFKKAAGLKACKFIKKRLQHRCFPVTFAKFLKTTILKNICQQLILSCAQMRLPISESASINPTLNCWVDGKDTYKKYVKLVQNHQQNMSNYLNSIYFQACTTISSSDHQEICPRYSFTKTASMLSLFPGVSWFLDIVSWKLISFQPILLKMPLCKDTHKEKALSNKAPALTKSMNMYIWVFGTSNQLIMFLNWNTI